MNKRRAKKRRRKNEDGNDDEFQVVSCKLRRTVHAASGAAATSYVRCGNKVDTFKNRKRKSKKEKLRRDEHKERQSSCVFVHWAQSAVRRCWCCRHLFQTRKESTSTRSLAKTEEWGETCADQKKIIFTISQFNFRYMKAFPFVFCSQT